MNNRTLLVVGFGAALGFVAYNMFSRSEEEKAEDAALGYDRLGIIGDLGAATNRATGGVLAEFGRSAGLAIDDAFHWLRNRMPVNVIGRM